MNWLNGCTWFDIGMVMGSNLGEPKLNSLFAKISLSLKVKGQISPTNQGGWKTIIRQQIEWH